MIDSVIELIRQAALKLDRDQRVDARLAEVSRAVEASSSAGDALEVAKKQLRERSRALKAAGEEIDHVRAAVKHIAAVLAFTPEGWPERREALERKLRTNPRAGITLWLDDWYTAASQWRLDALERLETVALPPAAVTLVERCVAVRVGLGEANWNLVCPTLEVVADGVTIGDHTIPDQPVRDDLRLLLVRLALAEGRVPEAVAQLDAVSSSVASGSVVGLRGRAHRIQAESALEGLDLAMTPTNLDVATELIEGAHATGNADLALEIAHAAIAALPVVVDVEAELGRLIVAPTELWLAAAERALDEGIVGLSERAVEQAQRLVGSDDALKASLDELQARAAGARGDTPGEINALLDAALHRVALNQLDVATVQYERVLELENDHDDAALRLADCRIALANAQPLALARGDLERELGRIREVQRRGGIGSDNSWSYLSEAAALQRLASLVDPDSITRAWEAVVAVCRSLTYGPTAANRWQELAAAAHTADLRWLCRSAAAHAVQLDPDDPVAANWALTSLVNIGAYDDVLARLGEDPDAWSRATKSYALLRKGDPEAALASLTITPPDPNWSWASQTLITALLLTGRDEEALRRASEMIEWWSERRDDVDGAWSTGWASVIVGDFDTADAVAATLGEARGGDISALSRFLQGDTEAALEAVRGRIAAAFTPTDLDDVSCIFLPTQHALARIHGLSPADLSPLADEIARRREELQAAADPVRELLASADTVPDADVASTAYAMCAALLDVAGDESGDLAPLEALSARRVGDVELESLLTLARQRPTEADPQATPEWPESDESEPDTVERLDVLLPPSWFAGHADPLNDHPFFLRYIPEIRARATWPVPAVQVRTDDSLEPDGYRISAGAELLEEGSADRDCRYAVEGALELLQPDIVEAAEPAPFPGLVRFPSEASEQHGLLGLLSMSAEEVIARRIADVSRPAPVEPEPGGPSWWSPRRVKSVLTQRGG